MRNLLNGRERFASNTFKDCLERYLGELLDLLEQNCHLKGAIESMKTLLSIREFKETVNPAYVARIVGLISEHFLAGKSKSSSRPLLRHVESHDDSTPSERLGEKTGYLKSRAS